MKIHHWKPTPLLVALMAAGLVTTAGAATALNGRIDLRPLSPSDIKDYSLTGAQGASGLSTIALGEPAYLEAQVNSAIPASSILSVTWTLDSKPIGSSAVLSNSPLGINIPIYAPADQLVYRVASRMLLRPDVRGQYTVSATIVTDNYGTTNVTQNITGGTYMGVQTCALCHSGSVEAPDIYHEWAGTLHSSKFTRGINGQIAGYSKNCISCHTVGYDANPLANNGGFDDMATALGWTFPTVLTNGNFQAMPGAMQNLANIQCENCHGPGSEHAYALGDTTLPNWPRLSVTINVGNCGQCHDAKTHHNKVPEWKNSKHAITTSYPTGAGHEACVGCHSGRGFIDRMEGENTTSTNTEYAAIGCATCHDPHDAGNPHQLRNVGPVTFMDGTSVTNGGNGLLCMNCHHARVNAATYVDNTAGSAYFGPHHGPQGDMLEGLNGYTYGKAIPSSAHRDAVPETCATCHMQNVESTAPAWLHAGGHTFRVSADDGTNTVDLTGACQGCHGSSTIKDSFDFPLQDYNGDGVVEGVQTEVQHLLDKLAMLLPPVGTPKSDISINSTWTKQQLRAGYNYKFVKEDGSFGIHNTAYAVGLLKASIGDLTGDANNDGLPDAWQTQYFGSASSPNAAPNSTPAGDGIPNWVKFSLGLNPTIAGQAFPGGVVWASGSALGSSSATNTVQIYTAAEVAFNTEVGKSYQVQVLSPLNGTWQNLGNPIVGDGKAVSYVTPTRKNLQQFFRVQTLP